MRGLTIVLSCVGCIVSFGVILIHKTNQHPGKMNGPDLYVALGGGLLIGLGIFAAVSYINFFF